MAAKKQKRKLIKKRLFTKNRLVILNEDSFEEIFSLRLTLMNVFVVAMIGAILLVSVTTYIIAFTHLREFIPGYASTELKRNATELALKSDSLSLALKNNNAYLTSIQKVLNGELEPAEFNRDSILASTPKILTESDVKPSDAELKLREQVMREDKYNVFEKSAPKTEIVFFPPVKGMVTDKFNPRQNHLATDIALAKNTPVKAVLYGTVIFSDWTPSTGNVVVLRHNNGFISVYKHMSAVSKAQGDIVKTGEVIATAGSGGRESTGIHLHFELWKDGHAVDAENFMSFD